MFAALRNKLADLSADYARFNDRETAEAIVAVMTGAAYADGQSEDAEKAKLIRAFQVSPVLKQFDQGVLLAKHRQLAEQFEFDTDMGLDACLKELADVAKARKPEEQRIAILRMGIASANADGEMEPAEVAFLKRAAGALEIAPGQVGL